MAASHIYLLSPANCAGQRARMLMRPRASFELAMQLRTPMGAPIADVFAFLSGLYFRGKVAYARRFAARSSYVITSSRGLVSIDAHITIDDLHEMKRVPIDADERRYREAIQLDLRRIARNPDHEVVLLGSIATKKYVDVLLPILGERLLFPSEFVGRGDMSRGGLMLRRAESGETLTYISVEGAVRHGSRPPKLEPRRWMVREAVRKSTRRREARSGRK